MDDLAFRQGDWLYNEGPASGEERWVRQAVPVSTGLRQTHLRRFCSSSKTGHRRGCGIHATKVSKNSTWLQSVLGIPFGERQLPMFLVDGAAQSRALPSSVRPASAIADRMATSYGSALWPGPQSNAGQHF